MATESVSGLLERDAELNELGTRVAMALSGEGQTILIEGPAGVGKSALLAATVDGSDHGARVLRAAGSELERDFAFGAVRQLFEPALAGASDAERRSLLAGPAAPAEWVVGADGAGEGGPTRAEAGFAVLHAIHWLTANLAADAPLLLAVDDLHWVDEPSLRALAFLARRLPHLPVALVGTLRSSEPGTPPELDSIRAAPGVARVAPAPLGPVAVAALVRRRIPDADDALCEAFLRASAGNPLYLRELMLSTAGLVAGPDAPDVVRRVAVRALADRVARRIARLAPRAEALATSMALLGDGGSLRIAADLASVDYGVAADIARELVEIEVLASDDPVAFAHPVLRRSLHDRLTPRERNSLHERAASLLQGAGARPEAVATHLSALVPSGSNDLAATLVDAARVALSRAAPSAAVPLLRRALEEDAPDPPRWSLLYELGRAEMIVRDQSSVPHLVEAFELAPDPQQRARVAIHLTELLVAVGQWDAGRDVLARARADLGESDPELLVELECLRAVTTAFDPSQVADFDRNRGHYEELSKGDAWAAHALAALLADVAAMRCEPRATVFQHLDRALRGGRLVRERGGGAWATAQLILALAFTGEYDRLVQVSDEVAAAGRRSGSLIGTFSGISGRALVLSKTGNLREAEAELRTLLDLAVESGMTLWLATILHFFIDTILERPQVRDAAELAAGLELDPAFAATGGGAQLREARGRLALARNDRDRGLPDLEACVATNTALGIGPNASQCRSVLALALPPEERPRAERLVADELELARECELPEVEGVTLRAAGMLEGGEHGIELLRDSVAMLDGTPHRVEHARSLIELGAALRRASSRKEGRGYLEAGMDIAYDCGAERLMARADEELHAAGARPRRPARSGVDALTASELRVARLAAKGRSNLAIAQDLYVSAKTVETHLSRAYRKLGLSGRGARERLGAALK